MKRIILTFGLISGAVVSAFMAVSMTYAYRNASCGGAGSMLIGYLSMLIAFALIFVAVKTYRDKSGNGTITFGKAFQIGLLIALIASTMYVVTWAILYHTVMPDFMDLYTKQMLATTKPEEYQAKVAEVNEYKAWYKNPFMFALMTYMEILPVGLLVSLVAAITLKRKHQR